MRQSYVLLVRYLCLAVLACCLYACKPDPSAKEVSLVDQNKVANSAVPDEKSESPRLDSDPADTVDGIWMLVHESGYKSGKEQRMRICQNPSGNVYNLFIDGRPTSMIRTGNRVTFERDVNATAAGWTIEKLLIKYAYSGAVSSDVMTGTYVFVTETDLSNGDAEYPALDQRIFDSPVNWTATRSLQPDDPAPDPILSFEELINCASINPSEDGN